MMSNKEEFEYDISIVIPALDEPYLETLKKNIMYRLRNHGKIQIIVDDSLGCGQAILNGISQTSGEIIVVMDADGSHNPTYLPYIIGQIYEGKDICYGVKKNNKDIWYRKLVTKIFDILGRIFVKDYPDLMSGYFGFHYSMGYILPKEINHPKVLMKMIQNYENANVGFVNITFEQRKSGKSKLGKPSIAYRIIKDMIKG